MRILVIEDDEGFANNLKSILESRKMSCEVTNRGDDGVSISRLYTYDAIILDLMLPDIKGTEVIKQMRALKIETPLLVVSGLKNISDKVISLELGADDYLTKPFDGQELIARIQTVIRRSRGHSSGLIRTGRLTVDIVKNLVYIDDKVVVLTESEYRILHLLASRKGSTLSKETVMNYLYNGDCEPNFKIIDVFICKLRGKLSKALDEGDIFVGSPTARNLQNEKNYIGTVWGRGYVLNDIPVPDSSISADMLFERNRN